MRNKLKRIEQNNLVIKTKYSAVALTWPDQTTKNRLKVREANFLKKIVYFFLKVLMFIFWDTKHLI